MRWLVIFVECLFVFIFIPMIGVNVWESKANSIVQHADILLGTNPAEAIKLYRKASDLCIGGSVSASNRLVVCSNYGIGGAQDLHSTSLKKVFRLWPVFPLDEDDGVSEKYPNSKISFIFTWPDEENDLSAIMFYEIPEECADRFQSEYPLAEYMYTYSSVQGTKSSLTNSIASSVKSYKFLQSIVEMPSLQIEMERKLWEESRCFREMHDALVARIKTRANGNDTWAIKEFAQCYVTGTGVTKNLREAFDWYLKAAELGDVEAEGIVALCYRDGRGVKKDDGEMVKWLKKSADHSCSATEFMLGQCYETGRGVPKDEKIALEWYRKAAQHGNVNAYSLLAFKFLDSMFADEAEEAMKWLQKAAEKGDTKAETRLGLCYMEGKGVKKNADKAFQLFRKAADKGDFEAMLRLGICYCDGEGVIANAKNGFKWIETAANKGHVVAQRMVGWCYENGVGMKADLYQAFKWYKKAADNGDSLAKAHVGVAYASGIGVAKNEREAVKWLEASADGTNTLAHAMLGLFYLQGLGGLKQDFVKAAKLLELPAKEGDETSQCFLAMLYANGHGVEKNLSKAFTLYLKSANKGFAPAQHQVGECYFSGSGVEKNTSTAFSWYKKAAEQGDENGEAAVALCYIYGVGVAKDTDKGYEWAIKSAAQNCSLGQYLCGICHENGYGKDASRSSLRREREALVWYSKAADQGFEAAKKKVLELTEKGVSIRRRSY